MSTTSQQKEMSMLDLNEIVARLKDEPNLSVVAREVKCTRSYISQIANGNQLNPSYDMIKKLSDYFDGERDD